jgi:hypothetical protein
MPTPAEEILAKAVMPTGLSSAEIRDTVSAEIRRRSFFSARTAEAEYLQKARQVCADVAAGRIGKAKARELMARFLAETGYDGTAGGPGPITDVGSEERLNLIVDTQRDMAHSVARLEAQTPEVLDQFPAWRLRRYGERKDPRNWELRWIEAYQQVGGEGCAKNGELVALKSSPIWAALGSGAGKYTDTLGNPYPPFAFNSGMDWDDVDYEECRRLGIIPDKQRPKPAGSLTPGEADFKRVAEKLGVAEMRRIRDEMEAMR